MNQLNTTRRALDNRHERNVLISEYNGKCASCNRELEDNWHADHTIPYRVTGRTNLHEMQPLCGPCNLRKGAVLPKQKELEDIFSKHELAQMRPFARQHAKNMLDYPDSKLFLADVAPACGKSDLIAISLKICKAQGIADKVCAVVPTTPLKRQIAQDFMDLGPRTRIGHSYTINEVTNEFNPSKGTDGFTTTYQALGADSSLVTAAELERSPYLLMADECHHIEDNKQWHRAIQPLFDNAAKVVLMSGSLERGDLSPIAFLPYRENAHE